MKVIYQYTITRLPVTQFDELQKILHTEMSYDGNVVRGVGWLQVDFKEDNCKRRLKTVATKCLKAR